MALELTSDTDSTRIIRAGVTVEIVTRKLRTENKTTKSDTVEVRPVEHSFAAISGLLEHHPLRDEYLEALGITE